MFSELKKYFPFFKKYKKALLLAPGLVIVDVICEIVQPELMSRIVDFGVGQKSLPYILHTGGIMIVLSLIAIAANIGSIYYSSHASVGFAAELRKGLFEKIQAFSFSTLDRFSSSSLVTRVTNDVNILQDVIVMSLRLLIRAPLMLLFAVVIAIRINATLASIIAVAIPVLAGSIYIILRRGLPYFVQMQKKLDRVNATVQEYLVNVRVVKSFVREDFEEKKFEITNEALREMAVKASGMVVLIMPVMQLIMNISIVAIVWFGGNRIMTGNFQIGQLMSFITYITQILMSLTMLSMTIMAFSRAEASSERVLEVLETSTARNAPFFVPQKELFVKKGKVEFKNVYFKYNAADSGHVLKNINLIINPGETVAIIGATGAAKSTLVQLIPGLYEITSGSLLVDDINIQEYALTNLRLGVNLVLQQNELFSGTIRENLKWGDANATDAAIVAAARDAEAHDFIMSFPLQYETMLGQSGVNISGGQKQRICLARAILRKPVVLILDDSTSAIDTSTEARIRKSFNQHLKGTTIIIIAQRISSVQGADRIVVMNDGEIISTGTHNDLLKSSPVYQEIYHSQQLSQPETV